MEPTSEVPDVNELAARIEEVEELADRYAAHDPAAHAEVMKIRLKPLDPRRPARDLLEDLLSGIQGLPAALRRVRRGPRHRLRQRRRRSR
jgi:hypothetical protein